jgi:serine/threonine protein kinase
LFDYYPQSDLFEVLTAVGPLSQDAALDVMIGILSALSHIHSKGIIHRDVKAENVLLNDQGQAVLIDFGIATFLEDMEGMSKTCGSPCYAAPEVVSGAPYDTKADVFSAGVIFYYVLSRKLPFTGSDLAAVLRRLARCRLTNLFDALPWASVDIRLKEIIVMMLDKSVDHRVSSAQALALVQGVDSKTCQNYGDAMLGSRAPWPQRQAFQQDDAYPYHNECSVPVVKQSRDASHSWDQTLVCNQSDNDFSGRYSWGQYSEASMSNRDSYREYVERDSYRESWGAVSDTSLMYRESYESTASTVASTTFEEADYRRRPGWNDTQDDYQQGAFGCEDLCGDACPPFLRRGLPAPQGATSSDSSTRRKGLKVLKKKQY